MATSWQIGDRIQNRWEIHNVLRGGMGIVYIVYDHEFREPFAAKTFQDDIFVHNPAIADRFKQEAFAWINLDVHQNVTYARFVASVGSKPFLFLEYVSGGDLGGWIGTPRLTEDLPQILRFAIQFCDGMTHALTKGIKAHRDIKPQNCLITEGYTLKVTDFGLAKAFDDMTLTDWRGGSVGEDVQDLNIILTRTGTAAGTCTHMAPEQFDDAKHVDVRADVYAFGVMLFQMITGTLPFVGRTWQEFKHLHQTAKPPPLSNSLLPPLITVVNSCLDKDPARRLANFSALRERLVEIYEGLTGAYAPQPVVGAELGVGGWINKGASLGCLGRHEEAIACCDHALTLDPHDALVWINKGVALEALGQLQEALACYDHALALNPREARVWGNKGVVLQTLGRPQEALACYDHALALNPREVRAWDNKGGALAALGRHEEALACCDRALTLNPRDAQAWYNKGVVLQDLGRPAEALACYDHALALDPHLMPVWYNKGVVLALLGRPAEALACYDHALALNPRDVQAWYNKGAVLLNNSRRYRDALACFEEAKKLGLPQAVQAIALCRQQLGG